jgi:hypothetical protein
MDGQTEAHVEDKKSANAPKNQSVDAILGKSDSLF